MANQAVSLPNKELRTTSTRILWDCRPARQQGVQKPEAAVFHALVGGARNGAAEIHEQFQSFVGGEFGACSTPRRCRHQQIEVVAPLQTLSTGGGKQQFTDGHSPLGAYRLSSTQIFRKSAGFMRMISGVPLPIPIESRGGGSARYMGGRQEQARFVVRSAAKHPHGLFQAVDFRNLYRPAADARGDVFR